MPDWRLKNENKSIKPLIMQKKLKKDKNNE